MPITQIPIFSPQMFVGEQVIFYTQIFPKFALFEKLKHFVTIFPINPNFLSLGQRQAQFVPK